MLKQFTFTEEFVQLIKEVDNWQEAIRISAKPLLDFGKITREYVEAMIASVETNGPYIVLAPNVALPHARPENGSLGVGYSVMRVDKPVSFEQDGSADVQLFITLSSRDSDTLVEMMQEMVQILSNTKKMEAIMKAKTKEEIAQLFN